MLTVIQKIKPSPRERKKAEAAVQQFFSLLRKNLRGPQPELGGSFAKDTWLSGSHDIDIFIKFPYEKFHEKNISKILEKKLTRYKLVHGSRDYFQLAFKGYLFELIPVLDIQDASKAKNVTDVSPLHTQWVKQHSSYTDEIRLAKQFAKANKVYGAESYIRGFSGYLLEVLTIHYKGFFNLIKAASSWQQQEIIDHLHHHESKQAILHHLSQAKHTPLMVIDPVQSSRNIAAALSKEKFREFIRACKSFLHHPSTSFFEETQTSLSGLKQKAGMNPLLYLEFQPLKEKKDVAGSKLLKVHTFLKEKLNAVGFKVQDAGWEFSPEKTKCWYILENAKLPQHRKHYGPEKSRIKNLHTFTMKWKGYSLHEEGSRVYIWLPHQHRKATDFTKYLLASGYSKKNFKKVLKIKLY